ncbi:hypothetical protein RUND412_005507 [Rhizina undulata]
MSAVSEIKVELDLTMSAVPEIKVEPGLAMSNSMSLAPDFAPDPLIPPPDLEPPKPSSEFPTADKILELTRLLCCPNADSNVMVEDIILVPASTWDRNNSHWEHRLKHVRDAGAQALVKNWSELSTEFEEKYDGNKYREMLYQKAALEREFTKKVRAMSPGVALTMREKARKEYTDSLQENVDQQREVTGRYKSELEDLKKVYEEFKRKVEDKEAAKVELEAFIEKSKPVPKPAPTPVAPAPAPAPAPASVTYETQSQRASAYARIHQGPPAGYPNPRANSRLMTYAEAVRNSRKYTGRFDTTGNKRDKHGRK